MTPSPTGALVQDTGSDIDALDAYQDILQEVLAGRSEGHRCPNCGEEGLDCRADEAKVRLECRKCGRFFEGLLA